jgi:putative ABC transport system permease protein
MSAHRDDERLWARMRRVFRLPATAERIDQEIDEELRFHLEGRIEELMATGLTRGQAESEARRRFGDVSRYRRESRDIEHTSHERRARMELTDAFLRETSRAARTLRRSPGFTGITILTLALGIGAATAVFTLLDAVVLRPLPYVASDRLVDLSSPVPLMKGQSRWGLARHEMFYFLERGQTLQNIGLYQTSEATVLGSGTGERPERARWVSASASLFDVLGFVPARGRLFTADDNRSRQPQVVVLGDAYWRRRFGGDPGIVGSQINVEGRSLTVAGVLPPRADLPDLKVDLWAPAWVDSTTIWNNHTWAAIGRLAPGFSAADAQRELAPLTERIAEVFPQVYNPEFVKNTGFSTEVRPLRDVVVGEMATRALWILFGSVCLVLLIAGANVANLFLVRLDARRRDIAMRTALGADRAHLAWHYLTESLLLTLTAGVLAVLVAKAMLGVLLALAPSELPRLAEVRLGGTAIVFALGAALLTGLVFGVLPLLGKRLDVAVLREGGRGLTSSRARMHARRVLVAAQMAFAVVLLAAGVLMFRTFQNLRAVRPGFDPEGVTAMQVALPGSRYGRSGPQLFASATLASRFHQQLIERVSGLPGVEAAGVTTHLPLASGDWCTGITIIGATPESSQGVCPSSALVSPGYFEAMGIRVTGDKLTWSGMNAHDGAVVVSRTFADLHLQNMKPIGTSLRFWGTNPPYYRVVGIADEVRGQGVTAPPVDIAYFPIQHIPDSPLWSPALNVHLVIRSPSGSPITLGNAVARFAQEIDPEVAVSAPTTMNTLLAKSMARQSFTMVLLLLSAGIALLLSAVGIYGVISYLVQQRRGEIGVRMALGARASQVSGMVLRQSLGLASVGVVVGIVAALALTKFLGTLLYGVTPTDLPTFVAAPVVLLAVASAASLFPARRAALVDPAETLRGD